MPYFKPKNLSTITTSNVPKYVINLDLAPEDRWTQVIADFKPQFPKVVAWVDEILQALLGSTFLASLSKTLGNTLFSIFTTTGAVYYSQELQAVATQAEIPVGLLAIVQLSYEFFACCTSIIKEDANKVPHHIRTMDWEGDILRKMTIECAFQRKGKTIFTASSWAGYIGVLTGMKHDHFSVSINFRRVGDSFMQNIWKSITRGWPVGFLVRETLDTALNYDQAVSWLSTSSLISPVYITIAGTNAFQGVLITRSRDSYESKDTLFSITQPNTKYQHGSANAIVQTNVDGWIDNIEPQIDILWSKDRLSKAKQELKKMTTVDRASLMTMYSQWPLQNETSIYVTYMCPTTNEFITYVL